MFFPEQHIPHWYSQMIFDAQFTLPPIRLASLISLVSLLILSPCWISPATAQSIDPREKAQLQDLSPEEQLVQRCDIESMDQVGADKVVSYGFAPLKIDGHHLSAPGAAFRKHGHWFYLTYSCTTSVSNMDVLAFSFRKGAEIPRSEWENHLLF